MTLQEPLDRYRRALGFATLGLAALLLLSWREKGHVPAPAAVHPDLLQDPEQEKTEREPFEFAYKGRTIRVEPVADYELWGLVVSHNDIESLADIYHDSSSVDTKDLCVVWGENLTSGTLDQVSFESGPWTCYFRYPEGVRFAASKASNNHFISDRSRLRDALDDIRVGDQIHVRGALVNYQLDDWRDFWRRSSRVRNDTGDGACEVIYFDEIEVLVRGTPLWYATFHLSIFLLALVPFAYLHSIWIDAKRLAQAASRKPVFTGPAPDIWPGPGPDA
ncbi:MAG: hypothetical protein ABI639_01265 [Thermoanaerobaculia bacterium]